MSGANIRFTLNTHAWTGELKGMLNALGNPEPFLKSVGEEMLISIGKRFKGEVDPDGKRWAPLAQATITRRLKKFGNAPLTILRARGQLAGSINYQVQAGTLRIGNDSEAEAYAAIHQFGGQAGRGHKVTIPARPYLGFSDQDQSLIEEEALEFFFGGQK